MNGNNISIVEHCSTCSACVSICPKDAISTSTKNGFFYPLVDENKCIHCGLCLSHCPNIHDFPFHSPLSAFSAFSPDKKIIKNSSSGGAFTSIASRFANGDSVIYASVYDKDMNVAFKSSKVAKLEDFVKSKYVESYVGDLYRGIKKDLVDGRNVLFSGTPCQCAGLKSYLGQEYERLLLVDFSCGGYTSHVFFRKYLDSLEKKYKSKIVSFDFRPKEFGWERYSVLARFANGKKYSRLSETDPYFRAFLISKVFDKPYCLECKYATRHQSDLTIADFWRYKNFVLKNTNESGMSLIVANTKKGDAFIRSLPSEVMVKEEIDLSKATYNFVERDLDLAKRFNLAKDFENKSFEELAAQYHLNASKKELLKTWLKQILLKRKKVK